MTKFCIKRIIDWKVNYEGMDVQRDSPLYAGAAPGFLKVGDLQLQLQSNAITVQRNDNYVFSQNYPSKHPSHGGAFFWYEWQKNLSTMSALLDSWPSFDGQRCIIANPFNLLLVSFDLIAGSITKRKDVLHTNICLCMTCGE